MHPVLVVVWGVEGEVAPALLSGDFQDSKPRCISAGVAYHGEDRSAAPPRRRVLLVSDLAACYGVVWAVRGIRHGAAVGAVRGPFGARAVLAGAEGGLGDLATGLGETLGGIPQRRMDCLRRARPMGLGAVGLGERRRRIARSVSGVVQVPPDTAWWNGTKKILDNYKSHDHNRLGPRHPRGT